MKPFVREMTHLSVAEQMLLGATLANIVLWSVAVGVLAWYLSDVLYDVAAATFTIVRDTRRASFPASADVPQENATREEPA